ncbi:MAG: hypothetical protein QW293_07605, partial [Candidatus Nitrosocaldaceae archaeon]
RLIFGRQPLNSLIGTFSIATDTIYVTVSRFSPMPLRQTTNYTPCKVIGADIQFPNGNWPSEPIICRVPYKGSNDLRVRYISMKKEKYINLLVKSLEPHPFNQIYKYLP